METVSLPGISGPWEELGIEFVQVPGGTFMMGHNEGAPHEKPVHSVSVTSFLMARKEITGAQFARFVEATGHVTDAEKSGYARIWTGSRWENSEGASWSAHPCSQGPHTPAACISWNDAEAFCLWAGLRLPTEAEWEYAAGGGGSGRTVWAGTDHDGELGDYAWFRANSWKRTQPAASRKPNSLGLFDMSGNVWEWCADWYGEDYYKLSPSEDPRGPESGRTRVAKGGSAFHDPTRGRVAHRGRYLPSYAHGSVGFRPVLDVPR